MTFNRVFKNRIFADCRGISFLFVAFLKRRIRGYVESFENSSFTRPSGGVFEVKFAKTQKMKRRYLEVNLKSH